MVLDQEKVLPNEKCTDLVDAKTNLISLSQNEYLEYTKIKDLKLKYEKADELLQVIVKDLREKWRTWEIKTDKEK